MTSSNVQRYIFTPEEVAQALLPNIPAREEIQVRFNDGYVEIDIVNPRASPTETKERSPDAAADAAEEQAADPEPEPKPEEKPERKIGRNEQAAIEMIGQKGFQAFLEVKTEEAARNILLKRCGVDSLEKLDNNKTAAAQLHEIDAEFEAWCMAVD